jgi:hypothetical protein
MSEYKYDVAFSFLAQDESLASQLNDLIGERFTTFLYSNRQTELAGSDGEETFNQVFGKDARVVVVFFRKGWGDTPWTRIEQTALRNRAYHQGYDFALFIPLDSPPSAPEWLPKTQLWFGLERFGLNGAASVIEARIQQAGGATRLETSIDAAARLAREMERERERQMFLSSERGLQVAEEYVSALFNEMERIVKRVGEDNAGFNCRLERQPRQIIACVAGFTLTIGWSPRYANSPEDATLYVKLWKGSVSSHWHSSAPKEVQSIEYEFERLPSGSTGWKGVRGDRRFFPEISLADHSLKQLFEIMARGR